MDGVPPVKEKDVPQNETNLVFMRATIVKEHNLPMIPDYMYNSTTLIISGHAFLDVLVGNLIFTSMQVFRFIFKSML